MAMVSPLYLAVPIATEFSTSTIYVYIILYMFIYPQIEAFEWIFVPNPLALIMIYHDRPHFSHFEWGHGAGFVTDSSLMFHPDLCGSQTSRAYDGRPLQWLRPANVERKFASPAVQKPSYII